MKGLIRRGRSLAARALAERADPGSLPYALSHLPQLHLWAGRWDEAEARYRDTLVLLEAVVDRHPQREQTAAELVRAYGPLYELLREQRRWADGTSPTCGRRSSRTSSSTRAFAFSVRETHHLRVATSPHPSAKSRSATSRI